MKDDQEGAVIEKQPGQEFSSSELKVTVHRMPACRIELEVEAFAPIAKSARDKAVKVVGKEVTIAGFRKGKAPEEFVIKNYPSQVDKQWQEILASECFKECHKVIHVPVLNNELKISFNIKSHSLDGAKLILFFETEPFQKHEAHQNNLRGRGAEAVVKNQRSRTPQKLFSAAASLNSFPAANGLALMAFSFWCLD